MQSVDMIGFKRGGAAGSKAMSRASAIAAGEVPNLENCAKYDGVHSYDTKADYLTEWINLAKYLRSEHHVKNITESVTPEMISAYMDKRAAEIDNAGTYGNIVSAVRKFGVALDVSTTGKYGGYWSNTTIEVTRYNKDAFNVSIQGNRAPSDPAAIIASDKLLEADKIAVRLTCELGCRLSEAVRINVVDAPPAAGAEGTYLLPDNRVIWTAKGGQLMGGPERPRYISLDLATSIRTAAGDGTVEVAKSTLNRHLHAAADSTGQILRGGDHPFRHYFAQISEAKYIAQGMTPAQAKHEVSEDLGHHRIYTTDRYLRR
jgi:hypothetical protein